MATLVVLKTPFSASTASFFAALSTASSLRLAVVARLGAGPPGCTRHPTHHLTRDESRKTRGARRHFEACPLEALRPRGFEVRTKLSSAPPKSRPRGQKSGLHPSMQAIRLSR